VKQIFSVLFLVLFCSIISTAQVKKESVPEKADVQQENSTNITKPQKSITQGSVTVGGTRINYRAVAGTLIFKNKDEKPTCSMFYTAYFKADESDVSQRPITFIYNGGPGYSTMLLHIAAWGPQCVYLNDTSLIGAPYKIVNNDNSLIDASDLVFIDAPGTGFSRIIDKESGGAGDPKDFYGIDQDARAFATFITQFLSEYNRWNSPKYLFGESYGTFRSAVLANILETESGISLNGVIQLSQILNYAISSGSFSRDNPGIDQPYELSLPTFTATAWYHHKLPNQPEKLEPLLKEVEDFAMNEYALALNKGELIDSSSFRNIAIKLHQYTGLPVAFIMKANLRISAPSFEQTLLGDEGRITGRYDTRFSGFAYDPLSEYPDYDPTDANTNSPITAVFNNYVRTVLKYGSGWDFIPVNHYVSRQWSFQHFYPRHPINVMPDLAQAMIYNPRLKVLLNSGYFDLATPFFEGMYEMYHLPIPAILQKNIMIDHYYSGHMVYINPVEHKNLHDNVAKFINSTH